MGETGKRKLLRLGLHRLTLPFPALNEAPFPLVEMKKLCDGHLLALGRSGACRIVTSNHRREYLARLVASLVGRKHTVAANCHKATRGLATTAARPVPDDEGLCAARFNAKSEARQLAV